MAESTRTSWRSIGGWTFATPRSARRTASTTIVTAPPGERVEAVQESNVRGPEMSSRGFLVGHLIHCAPGEPNMTEAEHPSVRHPVQYGLKRALDYSVALGVLTVGAPLLVAIGDAIRNDSPGPALYRRERVGHEGCVFRIFKFRT